jgi:hypothetical protein
VGEIRGLLAGPSSDYRCEGDDGREVAIVVGLRADPVTRPQENDSQTYSE